MVGWVLQYKNANAFQPLQAFWKQHPRTLHFKGIGICQGTKSAPEPHASFPIHEMCRHHYLRHLFACFAIQ